MTQFEYTILHQEFKDPAGDLRIIDSLNSLGIEGWEIFETKRTYDSDHSILRLTVTARRELP